MSSPKTPAPGAATGHRTLRQATAGGRAANEGTKFHASVAVYVYASILGKTPLPWFGRTGLVPTAVSAETGGGGDDLQIEFGLASVAEVQARHQMDGGLKFAGLVDAIVQRTAGKTPGPIALVAGRHTSSKKVFDGISKDLEGLRASVDEARLSSPVSDMLGDPEKRRALEHLYVVDADFDRSPSPERETALEKLRRTLVDESKADEAWAVLFEDAVDLCATGARRAESELVDRLAARGIRMRDTTLDEASRAEIEFIRTRLLEQHYAQAAADELRRVAAGLDARGAGAETRAEAMRLLAHALWTLDRLPEAREAARRAVELDPGNAATHATYSRVLLAAGDVALAGDEASDALAIDPDGRRGWIAKLHVAAKTGADAGEPPVRLLDDPLFRADLASLRVSQDRWAEVVELTQPLLASPDLTPQVRFWHALATGAPGFVDPTELPALRAAEAELTALVASLRHDHPMLGAAYYNRSLMRRQLGDEAGATADEDEIRRVNRDHPEIVEQTAVLRVGRGDLDGALALLETSIVTASPSLLALRADLRIQAGKLDEAKRDLEQAAVGLSMADEPDRLAWKLGEVAVALGDFTRAQSFHDLMTPAAQAGPLGHLLAGVMAFEAGDVDRGRTEYESSIAAEANLEQANLLKFRLAMSLRDAKLPVEALSLLNEIGLENIPEGGLRVFTITAFEAGDLVLAKRAIDQVAEKGALPRWALSVRADIGLRSADPEAVVADLLAMEQQGDPTARIYLTLARCLIELGRMGEALDRVRTAIAGPMTPRERLEAGIYLKRLHHPNEALEQLHRAYREDRNDPDIQRSFASMVMVGGADIASPATVQAGTHVRLGRADGAKRDHSIFAAGPTEKALGELLVGETSELLGNAVGDTILRERQPLADEVWTVEEIVRAEVHAARTIVATFRDNFPNEPFFVMAVHVGDMDKVGDLTELLTMLGSRRDQVVKILELYHQMNMPLEWVANAIGASLPQLMDSAQNPGVKPLFAEWSNDSGYRGASQIARDSKTLVLTRSGLFTARRLGLLDALVGRFELVAPTSLEWQLREEVETTEAAVASGQSTIMSGPAGIAIIDLEPNDPRLLAERDDAVETLAWLVVNVRRLPRPLESLRKDESADPELDRDTIRDQLGPASFDASMLAGHGFGTLYADDLGLRRYAVRGQQPPAGISTATLADGLVEHGHLTDRDRGRVHADLILAGYAFIPPSSDLIAEAIHRMPGLGLAPFQALFDSLGGPLAGLELTRSTVAAVLKHAATQTIELATLEQVTEAAILGIGKKVPRAAAALIVRLVAQRELRLLPRHLTRVEAVCDRLRLEEPPAIS